MSKPSLRILHFLVQPVLVADDGENLTAGPVIQPQAVTLKGLADLVETWPAKLAEIERQAEAATEA